MNHMINKESDRIAEFTLEQVLALGDSFVETVKGAFIGGFKVRVIIPINELSPNRNKIEYADEIVLLVEHQQDSSIMKTYYFIDHTPKRW
jgi:hypothetical protein